MHAKRGVQSSALCCACKDHSVLWMSCPLGGSSISRLLMYISGSSIGPSGICMMDQYSCSTTNMDTATILWRTLNVGEYVLWISVTNNGVIWGLRRTRDPRFCSLLDKGCFALGGRGCCFKLECPHLRRWWVAKTIFTPRIAHRNIPPPLVMYVWKFGYIKLVKLYYRSHMFLLERYTIIRFEYVCNMTFWLDTTQWTSDILLQYQIGCFALYPL